MDEFAGLNIRDRANGMAVFPESQVWPPSVLLKIEAAVPTGADAAAYSALGLVGSIASDQMSCMNPVPVHVAPPSLLMEKPPPLPAIMACSVGGAVGAIPSKRTKDGPGLTTL